MYKFLMILCITDLFSIKSNNIFKIEFDTAYNQFYIGDKDYNKENTGSPDFWTMAAFTDKLAMGDGVLGIGTGSYGHIKADIIMLDKRNFDMDFRRYDHVVEGSLKIRSGILQITNCPDNNVELKTKLRPGDYRVRIYSKNLAKADQDLYEGKDSYKIEVWPTVERGRFVLKRYK